MATNDTSLLQIAHFADMTRWSAHGTAVGAVKSRFPLVPLSTVLKRIKEPITIENGVLYKRITVRNNGRGVVQRDELQGVEIGTKHQFVAHAGQFIISRIDARNGAFGIVPKELECAVVTNDFWLFDVKNALPEYLMLLLSSKRFQKHWQSQSCGTTNRQRITEDVFLNSRIVLPSKHFQRELIAQYENLMSHAESLDNLSSKEEEALFNRVKNELQINDLVVSKNIGHLHIVNFSNMVKWGAKENIDAVSPKVLFASSLYKNVFLGSIATVNPSVAFPRDLPNDEVTFLPMDCISDVYGEISERRKGHVSESRGYTRFCDGDIIWAKITPCMQNGKCAVANNLTNGYGYGSTEFHVIRVDKRYVLPEYVYFFLRTKRLRDAATAYFSGSAGQQRVGAEFLEALSIPLLPINSKEPNKLSQKALSMQIMMMNVKVKNLRKQAEKLRISARNEFENAIFGC